MPTAEIEIEIYCNTCGDGLCAETTFAATYLRSVPSFRVNACPSCLQRSYDQGYNKGLAEGREGA